MQTLKSLLALCLTFSLAGCGGGPDDAPELAAAGGTLTVDGKPVGGLTVEFHPDSSQGTSGPMSTAVTNDDGTFTLSTSTGRAGAVVGNHRVLVKCPWRLEGRDATDSADGFGSSESGEEPPPQEKKEPCTVNVKFESSETSTLTAAVPEGGVKDLLVKATTK